MDSQTIFGGFSGDPKDSDEISEILIRFYEILDISMRFQSFLPRKRHKILSLIPPQFSEFHKESQNKNLQKINLRRNED